MQIEFILYLEYKYNNKNSKYIQNQEKYVIFVSWDKLIDCVMINPSVLMKYNDIKESYT